jgi:hypothetical protein
VAPPNDRDDVPAQKRPCTPRREEHEDLVRADADFEDGDYIELSPEQLDHCIATGESPWTTNPNGTSAVRPAKSE